MQLIEVKDNKTKKEFLKLPLKLYKNEKKWIRPLNKDIEDVFNPKTNHYFEHGECIRWILQNESGETIGRVAAFIDEKTVMEDNLQPTGGMGFFECIEDEKAAFTLFDACKKWLEEKGMEAMDGPINFGERNKWWGLLVDGFHEPSYCIPYNFRYYKKFFDNYGFRDYFQQYTYLRPLTFPIKNPAMIRRYERILKRGDIRFDHLKLKEGEKYMEDFRVIFNQAWADYIGTEITKAESLALLKQLKPIVDEKLVIFAYQEERPIAFFVMIPEINQIFKYVNGKLDLLGKLKFLYHKRKGTMKKVLGLVFGVIPDFQGRGMEAGLAMQLSNMLLEEGFPYTEIELNWIGDFNPRMTKFAEMIDFDVYKTHITYRKLFDDSKPFQRAPIVKF